MLGFNKKTQDASPQENTGGENKVLHFIRTHKKRCIAAVVAVAVLAVVVIPRRSRSASADMAYVQEALGRRDIGRQSSMAARAETRRARATLAGWSAFWLTAR